MIHDNLKVERVIIFDTCTLLHCLVSHNGADCSSLLEGYGYGLGSYHTVIPAMILTFNAEGGADPPKMISSTPHLKYVPIDSLWPCAHKGDLEKKRSRQIITLCRVTKVQTTESQRQVSYMQTEYGGRRSNYGLDGVLQRYRLPHYLPT